MPTELYCIKKPVCSKVARQQSEWQFDIGVYEGINLSTYVIVGIRQRDRMKIQLPKIVLFKDFLLNLLIEFLEMKTILMNV